MSRTWFPSNLMIPLRQALLDCGPFDDDSQLRAVFSHPSLRPWRDQLRQAGSVQERVDLTIDFLLERNASDGSSVLLRFLRVLIERVDPADACHHRITQLTLELEQAFQGDLSKSFSEADEIASLKRQLGSLKRNLLTIEERKVEFIDPRSIPPDLVESEKLTRQRIAEIEARLAELEQ